MPVTVVAPLRARPGLGSRVIDAFRGVSPLVPEERGCERSAAHLQQDGDAAPPEVLLLDAVPLGDPDEGALPTPKHRGSHR